MIAGQPDTSAVAAALSVLDDHFAALNAQDPDALMETLHFPHYRLTQNGMQVWQTGETYLTDFRSRAGATWNRSALLFRNVVAASADKVHLDIAFVRYDTDDQPIGTFRSLWMMTCKRGRWAAEAPLQLCELVDRDSPLNRLLCREMSQLINRGMQNVRNDALPVGDYETVEVYQTVALALVVVADICLHG